MQLLNWYTFQSVKMCMYVCLIICLIQLAIGVSNPFKQLLLIHVLKEPTVVAKWLGHWPGNRKAPGSMPRIDPWLLLCFLG